MKRAVLKYMMQNGEILFGDEYKWEMNLPAGLKVLLVNRNTSQRSSSRWAQGGIASVTRRDDHSASHAEDTIHAGAGLCDWDSVRLLVEQAPQCVDRLLALGMDFDAQASQTGRVGAG